ILPHTQTPGATVKDVMAWHIRAILVEHGGTPFAVFKGTLGHPVAVQALSYEKKDVSYPACAIDANEGTYDGNWDVLEDLYCQRNIPDAFHKDYLTFIHGDLGTKERLDGLQRTRRIENTEKNRLNNILFIPGLFHVEMAAANAIWRLHVMPTDDRCEELGLYDYVNHLHPKATGEFTSKAGPSYHSMHDVIHHALWADVLDAFRVEVHQRYGHNSLESWGKSEPAWEDIVQLSEEMVTRYIPDQHFSARKRHELKDRDLVFESMCLRLQHSLLYVELCRSIKYGDVGRILELLSWWDSDFRSDRDTQVCGTSDTFSD
ncbi:hypothetical protein MPER_05366, partial [Moniliophthora perniciosa FA553]